MCAPRGRRRWAEQRPWEGPKQGGAQSSHREAHKRAEGWGRVGEKAAAADPAAPLVHSAGLAAVAEVTGSVVAWVTAGAVARGGAMEVAVRWGRGCVR